MEMNGETDIVANTTLRLPVLFVILCSTSYVLSAYTCSKKYRHLTVPVHTRRLSDVVRVCRGIVKLSGCAHHMPMHVWQLRLLQCDEHKRETGPTINPPSSAQQHLRLHFCKPLSRASIQANPKGAQLAFGLHDDAIQAYGRAVFDHSLGKVMLMNSRKQRSAFTHGDAFAGNHSEEHLPANWSKRSGLTGVGRAPVLSRGTLTSRHIVAGVAHSGEHPPLSPTASARQLTPRLVLQRESLRRLFLPYGIYAIPTVSC
jgi:hypothetical protein